MTNFERIKGMTKEELAKEIELIANWDRKELNKAKRVDGWFLKYLEAEVV